MFEWIQFFLMLIIILISAQLFSNALEYFGEKIGISTGVTGSIFAAISTALPETSIPLLAIIAGSSNKIVNEEIGVGAILGAPLMLSTLSIFLMAISVIKKRGFHGRLSPEKTGITRDLNFFLAAFFIAAVAMYVPLKPLYMRAGLSGLLIILYVTYIYSTFKASNKLVNSGHAVVPSEPLFLSKLGFRENLTTIIMQLIIGLIFLLFGAKSFINSMINISNSLGISALLLSLLIIPFATELPEKVNSILWVRKNQDTLGFGNITGALVFQGTLLPALGMVLTPWQPSKIVLTGIVITFIAAAWIRLNISLKGISILSLLVNGLLYVIYLLIVFW